MKRFIQQCTQLLAVIRHFHRGKHGLPPQGLLTLYRGLILSRILYGTAAIRVGPYQLSCLERFHRVALRQCLELPHFAGNTATLVEVKDQTIAMHIH